MSKRAVLEVIALDAEDAVAARAGGADRLELVTDMAADGLTPTRETFAAIRSRVDIPLRVMLRLADGFAAGDVDALVRRARELRAEGADA
ncbi:copper homeostasis protein CutC, partial [Streptomyces sp. NPDC005904]